MWTVTVPDRCNSDMPPDAFEQLVAGENLAGVLRQVVEHVEFLGGQGDFLPIEGDQARLRVDGQIAKSQRIFGAGFSGGARPAQDSPHPADQLLRAERLDHVIIRAQFQPGDPVGFFAARGQQDDRHIRMVTQVAGEGKAIHAQAASHPG